MSRDARLEKKRKADFKPWIFSIENIINPISDCPEESTLTFYDRFSHENGWLEKAKQRENWFKQEIIKTGRKIDKSFSEHAKGWLLDPENRPQLFAALNNCIETKTHLLIPCSSRLIRSVNVHWKHDPELDWHSIEDLFCLMSDFPKVKIYSWLNPEATSKEERIFLSKLGSCFSDKPKGRPIIKKNRRKKHMARIIEMVGQGFSWRRIASEVNIPKSTVFRMFNNC